MREDVNIFEYACSLCIRSILTVVIFLFRFMMFIKIVAARYSHAGEVCAGDYKHRGGKYYPYLEFQGSVLSMMTFVISMILLFLSVLTYYKIKTAYESWGSGSEDDEADILSGTQ